MLPLNKLIAYIYIYYSGLDIIYEPANPLSPSDQFRNSPKNCTLIKQHREVEDRLKAGISYEKPTRGESELVKKGKGLCGC
jgi:hypothetical protein